MNVDDLSVGQMVTVIHWYSNDDRETRITGDGFFGPRVLRDPERREMYGDVFRVGAISYPFVILLRAFTNKPVRLDLRLAELHPVSPQYVSMMRAIYEANHRDARHFDGSDLKADYLKGRRLTGRLSYLREVRRNDEEDEV